MTLDPTREPYVTLLPMIRSAVGDLLIGTDPDYEQEFADQDIAAQINHTFLLQLRRDWPVEAAYQLVQNQLTPETMLTSSPELIAPWVLLVAQALLNLRLQTATTDNIDITRAGNRISLNALVKGLQAAVAKAQTQYRELLYNATTGACITYGFNQAGSGLTSNLQQ